MPKTAPLGLHPGREKGYALDFQTPVRHVVTQLEEGRAAGRAPSLDDLTATYTSALSSDLHRVKLHELGIRRPQAHVRDEEAREFLMAKAIEALGDQVACQEDGTYVLTVPLAAVRYAGEPVHLFQDDRARFKDPYNPLTAGPFATNTRTLSRDPNLPELRESMRIGGWLDGHPAIKDERGVVIVGHRRLQIAEELGIVPKIETKFFGMGDDADRVRSLYALLSNLGNKPLTPEDRKHWVKHLYEDEAWSMERIGEALHVSTMTVSRDLGDLTDVKKTERRGRPRKEQPDGGGRKLSTLRTFSDEEMLAIGRERRETGARVDEIAQKHGTSKDRVYVAEDMARVADAVLKTVVDTLVVSSSDSPCPCPDCHGACS